MKPARFGYAAPATLDAALGLLDDGVEVLAGGQSLLPLLGLRERTPATLVDINRVSGLDGVEPRADGLRIGALVRHAWLGRDDDVRRQCPLLQAAVRFVAHPPVRNRGTFGGSLANAHPAAELAAVVAAAGGSVELRSGAGVRTLPYADFVRGPFETVRRSDELVVGVRVPSLAGMAWGFHEISRREREYALAGAVVALRVEAGAVARAHVATFGVEGAPRRLARTEALALGTPLRELAERGLDDSARAEVVPREDELVPADYRRWLAGVAVERAVSDAVARAEGGAS